MSECRVPHPGATYIDEHTEIVEVAVLDDAGKPILGADGRPMTKPVTQVIAMPTLRCARLAGHDGDHAGWLFSIRTPERWPQP